MPFLVTRNRPQPHSRKLAVMYIQGGPKNGTIFFYASQFHQILTDFLNFYTVKIRRQCVIKLLL